MVLYLQYCTVFIYYSVVVADRSEEEESKQENESKKSKKNELGAGWHVSTVVSGLV